MILVVYTKAHNFLNSFVSYSPPLGYEGEQTSHFSSTHLVPHWYSLD